MSLFVDGMRLKYKGDNEDGMNDKRALSFVTHIDANIIDERIVPRYILQVLVQRDKHHCQLPRHLESSCNL